MSAILFFLLLNIYKPVFLSSYDRPDQVALIKFSYKTKN